MIDFCEKGRASFILGGQWGSEGKGAASAWLAHQIATNTPSKGWDIVTTNAGVQSGHTSIHNGRKRVLFHLPTAPTVYDPGRPAAIYLNAGSVIDPDVLWQEIEENQDLFADGKWKLFIHPTATIITPECREAERDLNSGPAKIASTQKGVGEAIARKVLRRGIVARDYQPFNVFIRRINLNDHMKAGKSVLVEVPQGFGLSLNGKFYPHTTSRDSSVMQAMSDAHIHPQYMGQTCLVLRTYPIRVGNISDGQGGQYSSGSHYPDQKETSWAELGVAEEITTVTKRVRRVFTFSQQQLFDVLSYTLPDMIYITFCDYIQDRKALDDLLHRIAGLTQSVTNKPLVTICQDGPTTNDARVWRVNS